MELETLDRMELETLMISEIDAQPTDVTLKIQLLNFFLETKQFKRAYESAIKFELRHLFSNDLRWYDCLANLFQAYVSEQEFDFFYSVRKIAALDRRTYLSMEEHSTKTRTLMECRSALFAFDQALHSFSKLEAKFKSRFFNELIKHFRAQLSFYLAIFVLKRAKTECRIWSEDIIKASIALLLQATQITMDLNRNYLEILFYWDVKSWSKDAAFRISQAGHVLRALVQNENNQLVKKVSQFCVGRWRDSLYQDVFCDRAQQESFGTSYFLSCISFPDFPSQLLTETQLAHFDELSQSAYPDSLRHFVWLGLASFNENEQLRSDFRCTIFPDLPYSVGDLSNTEPETLNQLDVDAFLYAAVLCAKATTPIDVSNDRPARLPVCISDDLCSPLQADWWKEVYKTYTKKTPGDILDLKLALRKGIKTIRACEHSGVHIKLIVLLAKIFQERATNNNNSKEISDLEARANLYWNAAIPLLEKIEKNQELRIPSSGLFEYKGKDLTSSEIKSYIEDGRLFLACRLVKQSMYEKAIESFHLLESPYASLYQALIYKKLALDEINHFVGSVSSENQPERLTLFMKAQEALFRIMDRLKNPTIDSFFPLKLEVLTHLGEVEMQLIRMTLNNNLNGSGEGEKHGTCTSQPSFELLKARMRNLKIITENLFEFFGKVNRKDLTQENSAHQIYSDFREILGDQGRPTPAAIAPMLQPPERPSIPSLFPDLVMDPNSKEYEGFSWDFTQLNAPEEVTPLMPKYQSFEERFDSYKIWRDFNFRQVFWLTNFGFYFSHDPTDLGNGIIICFSCGDYNRLEFYKDRKDNDNCFYHHRHCSFMNTLCQNEWVKNFQRKIKEDIEPSEEFLEFIRKVQEKRIADEHCLMPRIRGWVSVKLYRFLRSFYYGVSKGFCLDCNGRAQVAFKPCGDLVSCTDCAKKRNVCS